MNFRDKRHKEIIIWTVLNLLIPLMPIGIDLLCQLWEK